MGYQDRPYFSERESGWGRSEFRFSSLSVVTKLIIVNLVIVGLDMFTTKGHWLSDAMALEGDFWREPWKIYQLFTYGFAHSPVSAPAPSPGVFHVLGNMLTLWFLGKPIEYKYGGQEFLKIYILGMLLSGLCWALIHTLSNSPASAVGASGAVSTIVALFIFNYPRQTLLLFGVIPIPAWLLGVLLIFVDVRNSVATDSTIAGEAHLSGAAFGAMYYYFGWNFHWLRFGWLVNLIKRKPSLRVHDPEDDFSKLQRQADTILQKISLQGEESLSTRERRTLERYSQKIRDRKQLQ